MILTNHKLPEEMTINLDNNKGNKYFHLFLTDLRQEIMILLDNYREDNFMVHTILIQIPLLVGWIIDLIVTTKDQNSSKGNLIQELDQINLNRQ